MGRPAPDRSWRGGPPECRGANSARSPTGACGRGSADLRAAETFLLWLYRPAQRPALAGAGIIPVQSDPRAQARYWANKPADVRAVGDWTRFQAYMLGWPGIPPQNLMADAMAQAVADPGALPTALARAAGAMNAWVAKNGAA